jgi:hypothetical protein
LALIHQADERQLLAHLCSPQEEAFDKTFDALDEIMSGSENGDAA